MWVDFVWEVRQAGTIVFSASSDWLPAAAPRWMHDVLEVVREWTPVCPPFTATS